MDASSGNDTYEDGRDEDRRDEDQPAAFLEALGARLRGVRKLKRMSLHAVQAGTGEEFKASALGAYERGERVISVPRLQRLAKFYDVPVDELLPHDTDERATDIDSAIDLVAAERHGARIDLT